MTVTINGMTELDHLNIRAQDLGFRDVSDLMAKLEAVSPRYVREPAHCWSMELTVRVPHVTPPGCASEE